MKEIWIMRLDLNIMVAILVVNSVDDSGFVYISCTDTATKFLSDFLLCVSQLAGQGRKTVDSKS